MRTSASRHTRPTSNGRLSATKRDLDDTSLLRRIAEGDKEAMRSLFLQYRLYVYRSTVATWVLAIARNKALATFRRQCHAPFDEAELETIEDTADDPETAVQKIDRSRLLRQILADLPIKHREIIDLVYYHEKSLSEVATILGILHDTAKTRLFYARKHIAKRLKEACVDRACM